LDRFAPDRNNGGAASARGEPEMNHKSMTFSHHAEAWEWVLPAGDVQRVAAAPRARWLSVGTGRVWLTRTGAGPAGEDLWLGAGERVRLPAGSDWVLEAWPAARLSVLEERPTAAARSSQRQGRRSALWRRLFSDAAGWPGALA
jgi:Protein of unknown function (DUF2917)